jgi:four helix bundle protein
MRNFREVKAWQKAHALVLKIYESTAGFPSEERFGLTSQMRRAAVSIPTNIAEGCGRNGDAELRRFLLIAMGSASELEYLLLLACDLRLMKAPAFTTLHESTEEVKRMLSGFITKLTADS